MKREAEPNIHLYVDRLILNGLAVERTQASHVTMAIEAELTRLLIENGLMTSMQTDIAVPSMRANSIQLTSDTSPGQIGTQIAQAIFSGIGNKR